MIVASKQRWTARNLWAIKRLMVYAQKRTPVSQRIKKIYTSHGIKIRESVIERKDPYKITIHQRCRRIRIIFVNLEIIKKKRQWNNY